MADETRNMLRYRILRYTPNLVRDEWVNIGVLLEEVKQREAIGYAYEAADASFELLARRMLGKVPDYFDVTQFDVNVEQRINAKGDRVAMHSSVETRYPFLDEDVFAYLAPLHPRWKLRGFKEKYLLRRLAERWLPASIAWPAR